MNAMEPFQELPGLSVTVDQILYQPHALTTSERSHCFVYSISIRNNGNVAVTLKGRKWIIINAHEEITAVEGDGVVGQFPTIAPGEKFSYNSYHLLDTPTGVAEGSYLGLDAGGRRIIVRIPKFKMIASD